MQEWQLYEAWFRFAGTGKILKWQSSTLQIIDPGQLNEHQGPDIRGSRFIYNGVTYHGAVEMHVRINDWYNHAHHQDPAYRNVLLHLVADETQQIIPVLHSQSSEPIPTFVLPFKDITEPLHACLPSEAIELDSVLENLALQRLNHKSFYFYKSLQVYSAEQLFYKSFLRALGYPYNKYIFELLASRLPLAQVSPMMHSEERLMALYFGSAGFLKENLTDEYITKLYNIFHSLSGSLVFREINKDDWCLAAVRPLNHPQWRLAGWVNLLIQKRDVRIQHLIAEIVNRRLDYPDLLNELELFLTVKADGYWETHYALGKSLKNHAQKFFGRERIREIIINLIIPMAIAQARLSGSSGLEIYLTEFYLLLPQNNIYQQVKRRLPWLPENIKLTKRASSSQALLQLHENYCRVKRCSPCPIGCTPQTYKSVKSQNVAYEVLF
ncbi:MAG: DUF2851 family protein [Calditrichaeota bacterium]|nr:DUF2851 family protein [Calditrichota bacterium]